ncbi:hypothetical protein A8W25_12035 [Streptomyces sp. ERV7]|uniref:hypothetical protein n=1 Tax=Streptomyces sp. ERV7 TaxID=1322334 RepID=UPI0007F32C71|nr:hypothetical protein [Streptomyces sp. ERV7]OAR26174.1 hypothetical protein A8W25_12035 [Streptomyces sp. ERV7]
MPTLVRDPKHYAEAGVERGMSSSAADVAGPGLAGLLSGSLGPRGALTVAAAGSAAVVVALVLSPVRRLKGLPQEHEEEQGREPEASGM